MTRDPYVKAAQKAKPVNSAKVAALLRFGQLP